MREVSVVFEPYQPRDSVSAQSLCAKCASHLASTLPGRPHRPHQIYGIAAVGRPTLFIGSKEEEIPRILLEAQCGFSVDAGHAEEVSRIIRELVDHQETCLRLGRRARALFDQRFDSRHAMEAWKPL